MGRAFLTDGSHISDLLSGEGFAYQAQIIWAQLNYEPGRWVSYNCQFQREALACKDLNWSVTDTRLYSEAFTGRAQTIPRCSFCLQDDHTGPYCPKNPDRPWLSWLHEATPCRSPQLPGLATGSPAHQKPPAELCRRYNEGLCKQTRCRYTHACGDCGAPHPLASCPSATAATLCSRSPLQPPLLAQRWPKPHPSEGRDLA